MPTDTAELEAAFNGLLEWIMGGVPVPRPGNAEPYEWLRAGWSAAAMANSPVGPTCIRGPGFLAFLGLHGSGVGHVGRVDLRSEATPERLLELGRTSGPGSVSPAEDRVRPVEKVADPVYPWREGVLACWSILRMNHYSVIGQRCLFVAMERSGKVIQMEGPDEPEVWAELRRQAEAALR